MFMAERAPEWKEGDLCARCRTRFGTFNRQVRLKNYQLYIFKVYLKNDIFDR